MVGILKISIEIDSSRSFDVRISSVPKRVLFLFEGQLCLISMQSIGLARKCLWDVAQYDSNVLCLKFRTTPEIVLTLSVQDSTYDLGKLILRLTKHSLALLETASI